MKYDFSGYVTKHGLKCADGRTIIPGAFKDNDGQIVPLVWQHFHNEPANVLGHVLLENRDDGVYGYGKFNSTDPGKNAQELVAHKDIKALSIFANKLKQKGGDVLHGAICEVSLVMAGANPGAFIDFVSLQHSDGSETLSDEEAVIYTGLELMHEAGETKVKSESTDERTVQEVFDTLNEEQKTVVYAMVAHAIEMGSESSNEEDETATHSDEGSEESDEENNEEGEEGSEEGEEGDEEDDEENNEEDDVNHSDTDNKGETMKKNVFDKTDDTTQKATLTHDQLRAIVESAQKLGSLKEAFLAHAVTYGIENIDYLFPDAKTIADSPDLVSRRMAWVTSVYDGAKHSPFSRIKTMSADLTLDDARAKGYVKGSLKKEEFFALSRRVTTPTTIYKKQKLDREDIIDITELDVVAWLKAEMRMMLDEEVARAGLLGDGREVDDEDKINENNIRPIAKDDPFYAHPVEVPANTSGSALLEEILRQRTNYKGSGNPTFFTTESILIDLLLIKDKMGRRLYQTEQDVAAAIRVSSIIAVEVMEDYEVNNRGLLGIMVNMKDYTFGADKGGQVSMFDDFDIDYNQYKYLIEARLCGCLTKPKSALVFWRANGTLATPEAPLFDEETNTITLAGPPPLGVIYLIDDAPIIGPTPITEDTTVDAVPDTGFYFAANITTSWTFLFNEEAGA